MLDFLATMDMNLVQHILGPIGVLLSCALAWSPVEAVMQARSAGNLGGLDSKNWPLFFFSNLVWTLRSLEIGDLWVFLSCIMPLALWLWFSLIATKLLSQEEGELMPRFNRDGWNQHWLELSEDYQAFHRASSAQRTKALERLESRLVWGIVSSMILAFIFRPETIVGLEFFDDYVAPSTRGLIFAYICAASTTACWLAPMNRLRRSLKKHDTSSIFVPLVAAQVVLTGVWLTYGLLLHDPSLSVSNGIGVVCATLQLLAAGIYGKKGEAETESKGKENVSEYKPPFIAITADEEAPALSNQAPPSADVHGLGAEETEVRFTDLSGPRPGFLSNSHSNSNSFGNLSCHSNGNADGDDANVSSNVRAASPFQGHCNSSSSLRLKEEKRQGGSPTGSPFLGGADGTATATATTAVSWSSFSEFFQGGAAGAADDSTNRRPFSPGPRGERWSEPLLLWDGSRPASRSPCSRLPSASPTLANGCGHYQDYLKWQKDYVEWKQRSERSSERGSERGDSQALPDLADRLRSCGVLEEYMRWQADYQKWRAGSSAGAHGELDQLHLKAASPMGGVAAEALSREEAMTTSKSN